MAAATATMPVEHLIAFQIAGENYAVPISRVHEIIRICTITPVPRAPRHVCGVVNLRGKIVPVVDLRSRMGLAPAPPTEQSRIIVVESGSGSVGMVVDSVSEVFRLPAEQVQPPPLLVASVEADLVRGLGRLDEDLVILLDLDRVLQV